VEVSGILLAAGAARRFGGGKLLQILPNGTPVGLASLRNLREALPRVVVVVRPEDAATANLFANEDVCVVVCPDAALGMGHSLAAGIARESQARGWVIALADMPNVRTETIRAIATSVIERDSIVVPVYAGERGHPVGFSRRYRNELAQLSGDSGAKSVLQAHPSEVYRLAVDDPGIVLDIDTVDDLQRLAGSQPQT
jgi:molybdenum cofactor cytidylyltransferase